MYEPYGESRRFKFKIDREKLREWKGRFIENIKKIKYNKWAMVVIAIAVLVILGGYTGYVTYTGKIDEITAQIMVLERQIEACQDNVSVCLSNLENTEGKLSNCKSDKQNCENDLKNVESNLDECNDEKDTLSTTLQAIESSLGEWETKYDELKDDYEDLEDDHEEMTCRYANDICGKIGLNYYFVKDNTVIICCFEKDPDLCVEEPDSEDDIKEITC